MLETMLLEETELTVSVEIVNSDAEALAALCASPKGTITAAWLSGLAYAAAFAQGCGSAVLQIQRGAGARSSTGDQARIIVNSGAKIAEVADLAKHTFCRLGYSDVFSWLIPSLMIQDGGVAIGDLKAVNDYTDASEMIHDVASGTCDAAGIAGSVYDTTASPGSRLAITVLGQSATIPYEVLVIPQQVTLEQQQKLTDTLISVGNGTRAGTLKALLNQDKVVAASDDDLSSLRSFVSGAGIDLAQAGS